MTVRLKFIISALLFLTFPITTFAAMQGTSFQINYDSISAGGGLDVSENFQMLYSIGEIGTEGGIGFGIMLSKPGQPGLSDTTNNYDKLKFIVDNSNNPADTLFAIAITDDNWATTNYIQNNNIIGAVLGAEDWQTYADWGGAAGEFVTGLTEETTYRIKARARQGIFTITDWGFSSVGVKTFIIVPGAEETPPTVASIAGASGPSKKTPFADFTPPANVSSFQTAVGDKQITLKWVIPPDSDFNKVKIVRSADFYPTSPGEGIAVYEGKAASFTDTGLINGIRYYYSIFAFDTNDNYSSGAIVSAIPYAPLPLPEEIPTETKSGEVIVTPSEGGKTIATSEEGVKAQVELPAQAVSVETVVSITPIFASAVVSITAPPPAGKSIIGNYVYDYTAVSEGETITEFSKPIVISITYTDEQVKDIDISTLVIYYFDEDIKEWVELPSTVDFKTKTVTTVVDHFTYFALIGEKKKVAEKVEEIVEIPKEITPLEEYVPPEEFAPPEEIIPGIEEIELQDFDFFPMGKAETNQPLTVSIDYEKLPEVLKTIIISYNIEGQTFSYLLKINPEKTKYEATFITPEKEGLYPFDIKILDYKNQIQKKIFGELQAEKPEPWHEKATDYILDLLSQTRQTLSDVFSGIVQKIYQLGDAIKNIFQNIISIFQNIVDMFQNTFQNIVDIFFTKVQNIIKIIK